MVQAEYGHLVLLVQQVAVDQVDVQAFLKVPLQTVQQPLEVTEDYTVAGAEADGHPRVADSAVAVVEHWLTLTTIL
jgi:hypothetical protein